MNQVAQLKKNLMEDLELCKEEAEIFLALIKEGKTSSEDFKKKLDCTNRRNGGKL